VGFLTSLAGNSIINKTLNQLTSLKKNLPAQIPQNHEVWYFDESRFGTHSKVGHAWYKTGTRARIKINIGYKNFYLYSAINPKSGDQFTLLLPSVNVLCMNIFLSAFIKQNPDKQILMIMDGAAWHQSKRLTKHQSLKTLIQPPYSPELNPVERLWQHIKDKTIKNKCFTSLETLEHAVIQCVKNITNEDIMSLCKYHYN
jgi:transposase